MWDLLALRRDSGLTPQRPRAPRGRAARPARRCRGSRPPAACHAVRGPSSAASRCARRPRSLRRSSVARARGTPVPRAPRSARSADREEPALGVFKGRVGTNEDERAACVAHVTRRRARARPLPCEHGRCRSLSPASGSPHLHHGSVRSIRPVQRRGPRVDRPRLRQRDGARPHRLGADRRRANVGDERARRRLPLLQDRGATRTSGWTGARMVAHGAVHFVPRALRRPPWTPATS
jgi:hypothetical protein